VDKQDVVLILLCFRLDFIMDNGTLLYPLLEWFQRFVQLERLTQPLLPRDDFCNGVVMMVLKLHSVEIIMILLLGLINQLYVEYLQLLDLH
jgi:hypothetical protein